MNIETLIRENIRTLSPYSTARDEYSGRLGVYLDANESPYDNDGLNRYPDPRQIALKEQISQIKGVATEHIFTGNGSDEAIDLAFRVFCDPGVDNAVSIAPTYGMYRVAAAINGVEMREVMLGSDFMLNPDTILAATDNRTKLIFLCSPNNPTGNSFPDEAIETIVHNFKGIVVLDEAYIDYSTRKGFATRLDEFPNLVILQTLSKAWGMAGLRLGLAFADSRIIGYFNRVKYPYNVNCATQQIARQLLDKPIDTQVDEVKLERERVAKALESLTYIERVFPSDANFILARTPRPRPLYNHLIERSIIIRDRSSVNGCENCLRISIGTPEQNDLLINALLEFK